MSFFFIDYFCFGFLDGQILFDLLELGGYVHLNTYIILTIKTIII
jgi:hypothetical protein